MLTHFSLCSGIGGLDLAAEWAGFETVGQCEIEPYASKVLDKNFPGVHNYGDIRTITAAAVRERGITDITVLSAGIPCQPYSLAGKGLGDGDERDLEQELIRVIGELDPRWVIVENTPGLFARKNQRYFDRIITDLSALGRTVAWGMWGACDVGACINGSGYLLLGTPTATMRPRSKRFREGRAPNPAEVAEMIPTPTVCGNYNRRGASATSGDGLETYVKMFPTPTATCWKGAAQNRFPGGEKYRHNLCEAIEATPQGIIGRLNPAWVEWLQGLPVGWTDLDV